MTWKEIVLKMPRWFLAQQNSIFYLNQTQAHEIKVIPAANNLYAQPSLDVCLNDWKFLDIVLLYENYRCKCKQIQ
jgi:hypothetical protein